MGSPAARDETSWTYQAPILARVTFRSGRASVMDTWDPAAATPSGVLAGLPLSEALNRLGSQHVRLTAPRGYWLSYGSIGLAILVEGHRRRCWPMSASCT